MRYVLLAVAVSIVIVGLPTATALDGNEPPVVDAGLDQSVEVGDTVYLDGGGSFDPDGDRLTYEWNVESPDDSTSPPEDAGSVRTSFEASETGRYYVTLTATDEGGVERTDTLYVDVSPVDEESKDNEAPTGRIAGPNAVIRGESATFSADVSDPDGLIDSYSWSTGAHGRTTERTFSEAVGERVTISVTVTDDDGASTRLTKTVTVVGDESESTSGNDPPDASIDGPGRLGVGEEATFLLRGADSDGTVVRRSWTEPEGRSGSTITRSFDRSGKYTIRGIVTDDDGATATASHTVEVYGSGEPVVSISGPDTVPSGSSASYTLEAYDPDGGELTVSWSPAQTRLEREASPFENTVPVDDPPGETLVVTATVTDDEGQSVTVVKRTKVTRVTDKMWDKASPIVGELTFAYPPSMEERMDDDYPVHGGTYIYGVNVSHDTGERVNVQWDFNDSTSKADSLGPLNGTRSSTVEHQFMSEEGGKQTRAIWVEATDGSGDQTRRKWTHRVHTSARHDNIRFSASAGGESIGADGHLTVPVGTTVRFHAFSLQYFRVEFGDSVVQQHGGSQNWQSFQHVYDDPGTYTVQISSHQGPKGYGAKQVTIHVTGESYTEYWYEVQETMREQIISQSRPGGDGWEPISIARSERYFTGNTDTYEGNIAKNIELGDGWILNRTYTATRERTKTRVADSDPDGSGDTWTLSERRIEQDTETYYEDEYTWYGARYDRPGWSYTGETRTVKIVHGDGHDHSRQRHVDYERTSCAEWALDPSPYGGFSRSCERWNYEKNVWYTGHDHSGWTEYDTQYRYHREVERTRTVWLHEYEKRWEETVSVTEFAETGTRTYWLWERQRQGEYVTEYTLEKPGKNDYVEGTLRQVEVLCGSKDSHHDSVMC